MEIATFIIVTPLLVMAGWYAIPRLFPPRPIIITPIAKNGRVVIEATAVKVKPLRERIWESGPVKAIRLWLAIVGLISIGGWFIG
jgi:hypothetical protein